MILTSCLPSPPPWELKKGKIKNTWRESSYALLVTRPIWILCLIPPLPLVPSPPEIERSVPRVRIHLKILYSNFLFIHLEAEVGIWLYIVKTAIQAEICVAKCLKCGAFCSVIQSNSHPVCATNPQKVHFLSEAESHVSNVRKTQNVHFRIQTDIICTWMNMLILMIMCTAISSKKYALVKAFVHEIWTVPDGYYNKYTDSTKCTPFMDPDACRVL